MRTPPRHPAGECRYCDAGRADFCIALAAFEDSGGCEDTWSHLRTKCIPEGRGSAEICGRSLMGQTVWQAVCESESIHDLRGGRFRDQGDTPSVEEVYAALLIVETPRTVK